MQNQDSKNGSGRSEKIRLRVGQILMEPWLSALAVVCLFALLHGKLGDTRSQSSDEMIEPESIAVAKQKRVIFDLNKALQMDDFLQKNGWVEEIVH